MWFDGLIIHIIAKSGAATDELPILFHDDDILFDLYQSDSKQITKQTLLVYY